MAAKKPTDKKATDKKALTRTGKKATGKTADVTRKSKRAKKRVEPADVPAEDEGVPAEDEDEEGDGETVWRVEWMGPGLGCENRVVRRGGRFYAVTDAGEDGPWATLDEAVDNPCLNWPDEYTTIDAPGLTADEVAERLKGDRYPDPEATDFLVLFTINCEEWMWDGKGFRPMDIDPAWLAWNGGAVRKMAQSIRDERRFADLPILADALEEAGCDDRGILAHCRSGGEHARRCWVVDLLLGND
jgi:hypothetical protein